MGVAGSSRSFLDATLADERGKQAAETSRERQKRARGADARTMIIAWSDGGGVGGKGLNETFRMERIFSPAFLACPSFNQVCRASNVVGELAERDIITARSGRDGK